VAANAVQDEGQDDRPLLLFFTSPTSGPARRMASVVAWVHVTHRRQIRVVEVDAEREPNVAKRYSVTEVPALVVVRGAAVIGRLDGRANGRQIKSLLLDAGVIER
jgi:thioredoxin-like negative regulator of GroEL